MAQPTGGERFRAWRKANGLSLRAVAAMLVCHQSLVGKWEAGTGVIGLERLVQLHQVSGIPLWDLASPRQQGILAVIQRQQPFLAA